MLKEYKINPVDAVIKTVTLRYGNMNSGDDKGRLLAIECFDKQKKSILRAGWYTEHVNYPYHNVELEDDERIVGF